MKSRNIYLKIMLMAAACLFAAGLAAEEEGIEDDGMLEEEAEELPPLYTSEVEIGVGYSSQDSFKFGEYNGLEDDGAFAIGNITLRKNSVIGDADNNYWEFSGTNLGLDNRNIFMEYSHDGTYGEYSKNSAYSFFFEYDQLPHNRLDDAETPFIGAGTANQFLPTPWAGGSSPAAMQPDLGVALHQVDVETERQKLGGGFSWKPIDGWAITGEYHHEDKDGTETLGGMPNSFRSAILISPVNFDTDEFDIKIAYTGEKGQFELGYHLSIFDNDDDALRWENPFTSGGLGAQLQMGLAPDNDAQVIHLSGGYNLGQTTRITGNFSYSLMQQDETFLPYSVNPAATLPILPRSNLDGEVEKWFANIAISARPTPKLNLTGRYTYDHKDNNTPIDLYEYISRDGTAPSGSDGGTRGQRINRPYGYEKNKLQLDAYYRLMSRAKLAAGFEWENIDRNIRDRRVFLTGATFDADMNEVDETDEYTGYIKLMGSPTDISQGWVKYLHAERDGDAYDASESYTFGHSDANLNNVGFPNYENHFLSRKFYMADRSRDQIKGNLNFFPTDKFTAGFTGGYTTDDYDESTLGRRGRDNLAVTMDLSYIPSENVTTYAYLTHERIDNDQAGCQSCSKSPPADLAGFWIYDTEDRVNTVGAGLEWKGVDAKDKLDITLDTSYSRAFTEIDPAGGTSPATVVPFPDLETTIISLNVHADYRLNKQTSVRLGYQYEYFNTEDFALDGVKEDTIDRILSLGNRSPDYNVHVVGMSLIYNF